MYAPANTSENPIGLPAEVETDAAACGGSNPNGASAPGSGQVNALTAPAGLSRPDDVISDTRTFYDDPTLAQTWPQPHLAAGDPNEGRGLGGPGRQRLRQRGISPT